MKPVYLVVYLDHVDFKHRPSSIDNYRLVASQAVKFVSNKCASPTHVSRKLKASTMDRNLHWWVGDGHTDKYYVSCCYFSADKECDEDVRDMLEVVQEGMLMAAPKPSEQTLVQHQAEKIAANYVLRTLCQQDQLGFIRLDTGSYPVVEFSSLAQLHSFTQEQSRVNLAQKLMS